MHTHRDIAVHVYAAQPKYKYVMHEFVNCGTVPPRQPDGGLEKFLLKSTNKTALAMIGWVTFFSMFSLVLDILDRNERRQVHVLLHHSECEDKHAIVGFDVEI